jgi:CRP-like cAMP-binding protein
MDPVRLKQVPVFSSLKRRERAWVAALADEIDVSPGKVLMSEDETGLEFFVIEEGSAKVIRGHEPVADLGPGDFFGEIALDAVNGKRTASVVASSPMQLIVMTRQCFGSMKREMPGVASKVRRAIEERQPAPSPR